MRNHNINMSTLDYSMIGMFLNNSRLEYGDICLFIFISEYMTDLTNSAR